MESIYISAFLAFLFSLLTAGLLFFSVARLKNLAGGLTAAMLLLATPFFILMGISQFADVPFSFFILATVVLLFLAGRDTENYSGPLIMAGISAALAAWTKNEGILFFTVAGFVLFSAGALRQNKKEAAVRTGWFLAGALPVLLCVICFKLKLAPPNDLTTGFAVGETALSKLADPGRYAVIAKDFFMTAFNFTGGPVDLRAGGGLHPGLVNILLPIAWVGFMGVSRDAKTRPGILPVAAILLLMLAGYFAVYLLTPLPLEYHLATSLNRLYLQLWPSVIFLFFMIANAPAEEWSGDDGKKSRQTTKGRQIKK
jgi:4-amino-4-deoxy-L-arabinose transferase-like glycosyltransferase